MLISGPMKANHTTMKQGVGNRSTERVAVTKEERETLDALKNKPKMFAQDLCDICYQKGFILKKFLAARRYGLRFACKECVNAGKATWDESFPHVKGKYAHIYRSE